MLSLLEHGILNGSASASFEDGSDYDSDGLRCAIRVYERYSMAGGNRVSLNLTLVGREEGPLFLSAITSGGSQAMFFKLNTWGEEAFLECVEEIVAQYQKQRT